MSQTSLSDRISAAVERLYARDPRRYNKEPLAKLPE